MGLKDLFKRKDFLKEIEVHFEPREKYVNDIEYVRSGEIQEVFGIYDKLNEISNLTINYAFIYGQFDEYGYRDFLGVKIGLQGSDEVLKNALEFLHNQKRHYEVKSKGNFNKKIRITNKFLNKVRRNLEEKI